MTRPIWIGLLAFGTLGGYLGGFVSLHHHSQARREALERHLAHVCVDAARDEITAAIRHGNAKDE
jgi:hypothetical protein